MRKGILLIAVILLSMAGFVRAEEEKLGVDFDVTWVSKYLWRGIDRLDDKAALQPSIKLDFYDTGLSFKVWASYAGGGGMGTNSSRTGRFSRVNATEFRYILAYDRTFFEAENYATDVTVNYIYYDFIDEPDRAQDAQEIGVGFAWPNICPAGVVPSYYVGKIWPSRSNSGPVVTGDYAGWVHIFGLGYDLTVPGILPDVPEQVVSFSAALVYNDGYAGASHDWSHATFGISTPMAIGQLTFTPAVYYQSSFEDSVNTSDELYTGLSLSFSF